MPKLSAASQARLNGAHPLLKKLFTAIAAEVPIQILDSQRGRAAQERAFALGHSKAHFGQSAHNWAPALALDVTPVPLNWTNYKSFESLAAKVKAKAAELKIPLVWGGDWATLRDMPHYELGPSWRGWVKDAKPFGG